MKIADSVYNHFSQLSTEMLITIVKLTYPDAMCRKLSFKSYGAGERSEWQIVSGDWRAAYSASILIDERGAWKNALQRICREKWPDGN